MKLICGRPIKTCSKGSCKIDITFISYTRRTRRDFPHLPTTSRSRPGPQTNNTASSQKRARSGRRSWTDTEARARSAEQPKKPQTPQTQQGRGFKRMLGELDGKDLRQEWVTPTVLRECQEWGQMGDQLRPPPMTRLNSRTFYLASRRGQGMEKSALNRKHTRHSIRWSTIWKTARNTRIAMEIIAIEKQREGDSKSSRHWNDATFSKACSTSQSEVSRRTLKSIAMLERICNDIDRQILQVAESSEAKRSPSTSSSSRRRSRRWGRWAETTASRKLSSIMQPHQDDQRYLTKDIGPPSCIPFNNYKDESPEDKKLFVFASFVRSLESWISFNGKPT